MFRGFIVLCCILMMHKACAREFVVGGSKGWSVPSDPQSYSQWAERNRFQIGDSLLFVYSSNQDSVLQVTKDAYESCSTDAPIKKFSDGHTSFTFGQSGPYHFISGNKDNCQKNEKLVVIVMGERSKSTRRTDQLAPPPGGQSPAPAPAAQQIPSPPPTGIVEITPATPPPGESFPSAASPFLAMTIGSTAAFAASCLFLMS